MSSGRGRNGNNSTARRRSGITDAPLGAPKSEASNAAIPVNRAVIERIQRLKLLTVEVKAGHATRRYRAVKSDAPDDLVFQSVALGAPMRDNNNVGSQLGQEGCDGHHIHATMDFRLTPQIRVNSASKSNFGWFF